MQQIPAVMLNLKESKILQSREIPLSKSSRTLKPKWYRCPIERKKLRDLSQRSDLQGAFQAGGHLGLWLITALASYLLFAQQLWVGFFVALFLHGTVGVFFAAAEHELSHGTVFKTKWLNGFFLRIFCLLAWKHFHVYKMSHSYHHRFTLFIEADREVVLPYHPTLRFLYLLQLLTFNITGGFMSRGIIPTLRECIDLASNRFQVPYEHWGEDLYEGHPEERQKAVHWARLLLGFHLLVIGISIAVGEPILAVLISGHIFIGNWLLYFVGTPMHVGLCSNVSDFRKCTRTIIIDPVSEFLYWHMNWHLEHHMYAGVPCYNLKKLHQVVADDMPKPRTLVEAWKEIRAVWKKQLEDPDYAYDTPVPPPHDKGSEATIDPLAASIGDLAPKAIA